MSNLPELQSCDVLAFGPHPDDVEIGAAGTLLMLARRGYSASVVDFTRGEKGSHGSATERDAEARAATARLGLRERVNLGLPDTGITADEGTTDRIVRALRTARPRLLLAPLDKDVHPDHVAAAQAVGRAFFLAGLRRHAPHLGPAHRPRLLLRYPGNQPIEPTIAVDISAFADDKAAVVRCYESQLAPPDRSHLIQGLDLLERTLVRDRFYGARIGVAAAEPFWHDGPLPLQAVELLLGS
ncbi:MAG: bacillithiol biosynthesis deacetylase BshB1 [Planctomycetes bacterium]|nr:bacillithiol biosynthesis deacetylase BshB1 [Planctomycetota bacterium]